MTETWGLLRKMGAVHYFRNGKCIHPTSKHRGHGWLFVSRPDWDPSHRLTCPDCLRMLEQERTEKGEPAQTAQS